MDERPFPVFLSCGTPDTQGQREFISAMQAHLRSRGCEPQTVGQNIFSGRQPVEAARNLIGACEGAIVVAFERTRILQGLERPDSAEPKEITNQSHPTVWNQMEAAMAYAQRVPIMTLVQPGLKREGMLSRRFEWVALEKDLTSSIFLDEAFHQIFEEWISLLKSNRASEKREYIDPASLTVGNLLRQLTAVQLWRLSAAVLCLFSVVSVISFQAGRWYHLLGPVAPHP